MVTDAFGLSDRGPFRQNNEDAFACADQFRFYAVADGLGGHSAGEVASGLAVEAMLGFIERSADRSEVTWPYGVDSALTVDANRVRTAIHLANRRVFRAAEQHDDYTGMGTTVVAVMVTQTKLIVGHVGDSRLYVWSSGTLERLTRDDSWAMSILADTLGQDAEAIARHPMRNVLTNVLGAREETPVHMAERPLSGGELLLLCTDGVHGALSDADIAGVLGAAVDLRTTATTLVTAALEAGTRDNVTAVLVRCGATAP